MIMMLRVHPLARGLQIDNPIATPASRIHAGPGPPLLHRLSFFG